MGKNISTVCQRLIVQLLDNGGNLGGHLLLANTFGIACLPSLDGLSRIIVYNKSGMRFVGSSLEARTELKTANFLQVVKAWFLVAIIFGDIVLYESGRVSSAPNRNIDISVFVVNDDLKVENHEVLPVIMGMLEAGLRHVVSLDSAEDKDVELLRTVVMTIVSLLDLGFGRLMFAIFG